MSGVQKVPLSLRFNGFTSSDGKGGWTLTVTDENSRIRILEVSMTHEQVGHLLSSRIVSPLVGNVCDEKAFARVGCKRENTNILVPIDDIMKLSHDERPRALLKRAQEMAAEHGDGGWEVLHPSNLETWNFHRVAGNTYSVGIGRWVCE